MRKVLVVIIYLILSGRLSGGPEEYYANYHSGYLTNIMKTIIQDIQSSCRDFKPGLKWLCSLEAD
jgi:hypothetical protein